MSGPGNINGVAAAAAQTAQEAGASPRLSIEQQLQASRNATRLDLFASCAPEDIPTWVRFDGIPTPSDVLTPEQALMQMPLWSGMETADQNTLRAWMVCPNFNLPDFLAGTGAGAAAARVASQELHDADVREVQARRYFAWRWFYAQKMVASRPE